MKKKNKRGERERERERRGAEEEKLRRFLTFPQLQRHRLILINMLRFGDYQANLYSTFEFVIN